MIPLETLLICDYRENIAATVREHINALTNLSRHHIRMVSMLGDLPSGLNLEHFDLVVIHYSLVACKNSDFSASSRHKLRGFTGLKAAFVQDDYRFVDATVSAFQEIGIN